MLLELFKRDLRLHWDMMVLPLALLALVMGAIAIKSPGGAVAGTILLGSIFIPSLPLAIHLRENSQGTLGDLVTLPVSRLVLVTLRYVQVLVFAGFMIVVVHVVTWVVQCSLAHRIVPFAVMEGPAVWLVGMLLLVFFAYPMPFALRWNGKGTAIAYAALWGLMMGLGGLLFLLSEQHQMKVSIAFDNTFIHLIEHPFSAVLITTALLALSFWLSLKAFAKRDF